jgi:hypothetical protein
MHFIIKDYRINTLFAFFSIPEPAAWTKTPLRPYNASVRRTQKIDVAIHRPQLKDATTNHKMGGMKSGVHENPPQ